MDARSFGNARRFSKHRLGIIVLPTSLAILGIETIVAAAFVLTPVAVRQGQEREKLAAAVDRLHGIAPTGFSHDFIDNTLESWWMHIIDSIQSPFSQIELIHFGSCDEELECVSCSTEHPEKIGDAELRELAKFPAMTEVRSLGLAGTSITDAGLESLAKFYKLETLDLGFTKVSAAGVARLRRELPHCKIIHLQQKQAIHGRNFGPRDYILFKKMLFASSDFIFRMTLPTEFDASVFDTPEGKATISDVSINSFERFSATLSECNDTLRDVDLDTLSECLKAQILFYRCWGDAAALLSPPPLLADKLPTDSFAEFKIELFRQQFHEAWIKPYSTKPGQYSRIGVVFDFDINDDGSSNKKSSTHYGWCEGVGNLCKGVGDAICWLKLLRL
jgi:hypothetical protein